MGSVITLIWIMLFLLDAVPDAPSAVSLSHHGALALNVTRSKKSLSTPLPPSAVNSLVNTTHSTVCPKPNKINSSMITSSSTNQSLHSSLAPVWPAIGQPAVVSGTTLPKTSSSGLTKKITFVLSLCKKTVTCMKSSPAGAMVLTNSKLLLKKLATNSCGTNISDTFLPAHPTWVPVSDAVSTLKSHMFLPMLKLLKQS